MSNDKLIATLPIHDAIRQPGGNGLCTPAFQPPLNFMLIFSWVGVEQGVESLICNGELLTRTVLKSDYLRLMGRRSYFRRILMKPEPLEVTAQALSADQLKVDLVVSMKYEVIDPFYVASTTDPQLELSHLMVGVISECIRGYDSYALVGMDSGIKECISVKLTSSSIVNGHFKIVEILKVLPSIDERLINIRNRTREATLEKELIYAEGLNRKAKSLVDVEIARNSEMLNNQMKQFDHERKLEEMQIQERASITKEAIKALGEVGKGGIDPSNVAKVVISLVSPAQNRNIRSRLEQEIDPPKLENCTVVIEPSISQFEKESRAFQSIKERMKILSVEIFSSGTGIGGAVIQFADYEIVFSCGSFYPDEKPDALIRYPDGREKQPEDYWMGGVTSLLAQAVMVLVMQA